MHRLLEYLPIHALERWHMWMRRRRLLGLCICVPVDVSLFVNVLVPVHVQ